MYRNQLRSSAVATGAASLLLLSAAPAAQAAPAGPAGPRTDPYEADQAAAVEQRDGMTGMDTAEPREQTPEIEQVDEDTLTVEYPYGHATGAGGPEGYVESTFTWGDETDSVDHAGEFPPAV